MYNTEESFVILYHNNNNNNNNNNTHVTIYFNTETLKKLGDMFQDTAAFGLGCNWIQAFRMKNSIKIRVTWGWGYFEVTVGWKTP
jgi:hypothetical protein